MSRISRRWNLIATLLIPFLPTDGVVVLARLDCYSRDMVGVEWTLSSTAGTFWYLLALEQVSLGEHGRVNPGSVDHPWESVCRLSGDEGVSRKGLHRED